MIQWHPIFAHLLQPVLQGHYDIQTNVPVGKLPREADIILLRREAGSEPSFVSLWRHLSRWNILEFKGRSVSARLADLDLLVEIGLGIHRRLRKTEANGRAVTRSDVSFWYMANHLGKRFLHDAKVLLGGLDVVGPGLWRWHVLQRPLWLVSNRDVPVDRETVPMHVVSDEPKTTARAVAELVVEQADWWKFYGPWLGPLYPDLWKEINIMAKKRDKRDIDWSAVVDDVGLGTLLRQYIEKFGMRKVIDEIGVLGKKQLIKQIGMPDFVAGLSAKERQELERLLHAGSK